MGAAGFSPGFGTHAYLLPFTAPATLVGLSGLAAIGAALVANPTPGIDIPATGQGARNDVGRLYPGDGGTNFVRSYKIVFKNPKRSVVIVNYTIKGEHTMEEGFVLRFAELKADNHIDFITYGEGNSIKMSAPFLPAWGTGILIAWSKNAREIFAAAAAGGRR